MKAAIKRALRAILEPAFHLEARIARKWVAGAHNRLKFSQWSLGGTEFMDHSIDLFSHWPATRNSLWVERGVFGGLSLKGGNVLELSCGDGFNARHFYSLRSKHVTACDFDPGAIRTAKAKNGAPNVTFVLADIRTAMPPGIYENVVWDAAIEHFTPDEITAIMGAIKVRLTPDGVLSGYTMVEAEDGVKALHQHEYEFKDKADLARFLSPHFKHYRVFETKFPNRHNLYFWASDSGIPFDRDWPFQVSDSPP